MEIGLLVRHLESFDMEEVDKVITDYFDEIYDFNMPQKAFTEKLNEFYVKERKNETYNKFIKDAEKIKYTNKADFLELLALYNSGDEGLAMMHQEITVKDLDDTIQVIIYMHRRIIFANIIFFMLEKIIADADEEMLPLIEKTMAYTDKTRKALTVFLQDQQMYNKLILEKEDLKREALVIHQKLQRA